MQWCQDNLAVRRRTDFLQCHSCVTVPIDLCTVGQSGPPKLDALLEEGLGWAVGKAELDMECPTSSQDPYSRFFSLEQLNEIPFDLALRTLGRVTSFHRRICLPHEVPPSTHPLALD